MSTVASELHTVSTDETRNIAVDCSDMLDSGELLTGTPTVTTSAGVTLGSKQVNSATLTINGASVAAGLAVQFTATATTPGLYEIEITCNTDASQVVEGRIKLLVEKSKY